MFCYLCHGLKLKLYSVKNSFIINQCLDCGHLFVINQPKQLENYYSKGYFTGDIKLDAYMDYELDKEASQETFVRYLELLNQYVVGRKSLLEVGCATGFFLGLAQSVGWEAIGIDISEYAIIEAKKKNFQAFVATLDQLPESIAINQYGAIAMFDVVEHLADPIVNLVKAVSLLTPGGLLILSTPKADSWWARVMGKNWHAFVPPQHLHFFSEVNLKNILANQGMKIIWSGSVGKKFTLPYIFRTLYSWQKISLWKWLADWSNQGWLKQLAIPINLHDTMVILAKKE